MKRMGRTLGILFVLAGGLVAISLPAAAQERVSLHAVEPPEGRPGDALELTLRGAGFGNAQEVRVSIGGIEVLDAQATSDNTVVAHVVIPEDAPPGPRPVEVTVVLGPNEVFGAALGEGFFVLEREGPAAPGGLALYGVEPREVELGSDVELTLHGENFTEETKVLVHDGGVELLERRFVDPSRLIVRVRVSADATPGPRLVTVSAEGGAAELPDGIVVIEGSSGYGFTPSPMTEAPSDDGLPPWVLGGGAVLLLAAGVVIGQALKLKTQLTWEKTSLLQWEVEAKKELPEPKQACTWDCKAEASADLLNRWNVTALALTPLPLPGRSLSVKRVADEAVAPLNEAVRHKLAGADETRRRLAPVVDALLMEIQSWEAEGQTPASIRVDAEVKGDVKCAFALCHCAKSAKGLEWVEWRKWTRTLRQPGGEYLGVLRGPTAGEPDFTARARGELEGFLLALTKGMRFKL